MGAALGALILGTVVAVVLLATGVQWDGPLFLLVVSVPWLALAGWPLLATRRRGNGAGVDLGLGLGARDVAPGIAGGIISLIVAVVLATLTMALFGEFDSAAAEQAADLAESAPAWVLVVFAVLVVTAGPLAEELTFRGLVWSGLAKRGIHPALATVLSALAFAAIHLEPERMILLFGIGLVLGGVRWVTGSLGACYVAHAVNNFPGAVGILMLL